MSRLRAAGCVFAEEEAALLLAEAWTPEELEAAVGRRIAGEPLEHVLGRVRFAGLEIALDPGVFVPRARTAFLAEQAAALLAPGGTAVDLCCGSGAIAAVLIDRVGSAEVWAADVDPVATACARRNLPPDRVRTGDLFEALDPGLRGRVDVLVANTPYVPTGELRLLPHEAAHEPLATRDGGPDGLRLLRRIAAEAATWLRPGGSLLIEIGRDQAEGSAAAFRAGGLDPLVLSEEDGPGIVLRGTGTGQSPVVRSS